jgi:hypothetical protein
MSSTAAECWRKHRERGNSRYLAMVMREHRRTVAALEVFGQPQAVGAVSKKPCERHPAVIPGMSPQVLAIELEQVEGIEEGHPGAAPRQSRPQPLEIADTLPIKRHGPRSERQEGFCDQGHPVRPVAAVPTEHADHFDGR